MLTMVATGMRRPRIQGTPPIWRGFTVMRENFIFRSPFRAKISEQLLLTRAAPAPLGASKLRQFRPGDHEAVVHQGLVRPFLQVIAMRHRLFPSFFHNHTDIFNAFTVCNSHREVSTVYFSNAVKPACS